MRAEKQSTMTLVTEPILGPFGRGEVTWAVAVLDDGTEIRVRHLGDRIEVRGWDPAASMKPPSIVAEPGRPHVVDVLPASPPANDGSGAAS